MCSEITNYEVYPEEAVPYEVCDHCAYQEEGGHFCMLHGKSVKNMNINSCADFSEKIYDKIKLKKRRVS